MRRSKGYILVEGQGDVEATHNLVVRLAGGGGQPWAPPLRWLNLHQWEAHGRGGIVAGAELIRTRPDAAALLILRDEDDGCPKTLAPHIGERLPELALPFPTAYVLMKPEFEVLFLPCLPRMADLGFPTDLGWDGDGWEARRGVKGWLTAQLPPGRSYKPTVQQLPMTQRVDLDEVRDADVPCFGSLERAVGFLLARWGQPGFAYPPAPPSS